MSGTYISIEERNIRENAKSMRMVTTPGIYAVAAKGKDAALLGRQLAVIEMGIMSTQIASAASIKLLQSSSLNIREVAQHGMLKVLKMAGLEEARDGEEDHINLICWASWRPRSA